MAERRRSNVSRVEEYAWQLKGPLPPNKIIGEAVGLSPRQVITAMDKIRKRKGGGVPPVLAFDGIFTRKNKSIMAAKGNIWPDVKDYAVMGMRAREIHQAIILEKGRDLLEGSIDSVLTHGRSRGYLDRVSAEEKVNVIRTVYGATDEEIRSRVIGWLALRDFLAASGADITSYRRLDWMGLIREDSLDPRHVSFANSLRLQVVDVVKQQLVRANVQFEEPEKLVLNLVPPNGVDLRQLELPLLERVPTVDSRQISFEQYERQKIIEPLVNLKLFAAKLANLAKDVGWSPKANFESVARAIREKGINVSSDVQSVVNKVGFAVENTEIGMVLTRGLNKPKSEVEISEEQYLRYATYYLILAKFGLTLPDTPTEASEASYKEKVAAVIAKAEVQPLIKYWEITLEKFVAQLRK